MTRFSAIDLSAITPPDIIETLDVEQVVQDLCDGMADRFPPIAGVIQLESEPARKLFEECGYRVLYDTARRNDGVRACLLSSSWGSNLDHIAALFGVARATIENDQGDMVPEDDERLRARAHMAPDAFSVAGPPGAYIYHAMTAAPWARDVSATTPKPGSGRVRVTVMRVGEYSTPSREELGVVRSHLLQEDVVPLTDIVEVAGPQVTRAEVVANLILYPGPDATVVKANATKSVADWIETNRMLGMNLRRSALIARLHVEGVHSVDLISPAADVILDDTEVYAVDSVTVTASKLRDE